MKFSGAAIRTDETDPSPADINGVAVDPPICKWTLFLFAWSVSIPGRMSSWTSQPYRPHITETIPARSSPRGFCVCPGQTSGFTTPAAVDILDENSAKDLFFACRKTGAFSGPAIRQPEGTFPPRDSNCFAPEGSICFYARGSRMRLPLWQKFRPGKMPAMRSIPPGTFSQQNLHFVDSDFPRCCWPSGQISHI